VQAETITGAENVPGQPAIVNISELKGDVLIDWEGVTAYQAGNSVDVHLVCSVASDSNQEQATYDNDRYFLHCILSNSFLVIAFHLA
jgi:hypothetical protein